MKYMRSLCNENRGGGGVYKKKVGEITDVETAGGGLSSFIEENYPCIIRKTVSKSKAKAESMWSAETLVNKFGETEVTTLVFDGNTEQTTDTTSHVDLEVRDFVKYVHEGFEIVPSGRKEDNTEKPQPSCTCFSPRGNTRKPLVRDKTQTTTRRWHE